MHILESRNATTLTLQLSGRLNINTAPRLEQLFDENIGQITNIELDLASLEYISSAGLRVILKAQKQMSEKGSLIIKNANKKVMLAFEITGFTNILTIEQPAAPLRPTNDNAELKINE